MSLPMTLALLFGSAALSVFAGWRGSRPADLTRGPRMAPWRMIMLLSAAVAILALVHLFNLAGIRTGPPTPY